MINCFVSHNVRSCLQELEASMRPDTSLVSIMTVNNEIGVKQPVKQIGELFWNPGNIGLVMYDWMFHRRAVPIEKSVLSHRCCSGLSTS